MNQLFLPFVAALLLILPGSTFAKDPIRILEGVVLNVVDGDTITVNAEGTKIKVRLYGVDAPETEKVNRKTGRIIKPGQPYGEEAFRALSDKVMGKRVRLSVMDIDRYQLSVAVVWIDDRDIGRELLAEGLAWAYRQYLDRPRASEYIGAEEEAREERRGLWAQSNPQPPWEFR